MNATTGILTTYAACTLPSRTRLTRLQTPRTILRKAQWARASGMSCYSLKGGIGSASRVFELYGNKYTVGALLLTNFGTLRDLTIGGERVGERLYQKKEAEKAAAEQQDKGSVIIIIATDAPVSARQLQRVARRAQSGIARTGSISGNGSGEIALAFTTANRIPHYSPKKPISIECALRGGYGPYVPRGNRVR